MICEMQDELKDCGISCLLTIIKYYEGDVPKEYLRDMTKTTKDGVTAFYLIKCAQQLGFNAMGVSGDITNLDRDQYPVIAHTVINKSYKHFVVIYGIKNNELTIADPNKGIIKMSLEDWNKISTNNFILLKPISKIPVLTNQVNYKELIINYVKEYKSIFISIFIISMLYTILNIITSYNFKIMLLKQINDLKKILVLSIGIILLKNISNYLRNKLINYINYKIDFNLVKDAYEHIIHLPILYYRTRTVGDIIQRINDISNIKDLISKFFITVFVDLILVLFVLINLIKIDYNLTMISVLISIIIVIIIYIYNKSISDNVNDIYENASIVNSNLVESISSIETIKSMNLEEYFINKFKYKYFKLLKNNRNLNNKINREYLLKNIIQEIGNIFIIFVGILKVINNNMQLEELIVYITLLNYYLEPIESILDLNLTIKNSKVSIRRIKELYQIPKEEFNITEKTLERPLKGKIEFKNITYSYNGIEDIITNFNMKIDANEKVIILGESGTGKSTIAKMLVGFINDYKGLIYIDDRELKTYELSDIRNRIAYISQNEMIYTDSIYNNICLGKKIDYDYFLKICKLTKVTEIVNKFDLKYDSLLEENGYNLSSGEKQRIILARTILLEKDIYIFDESLNAIDIYKERIIIRNILKFLKNKTVIVISHRLDNEDLFDRKIIIKGEKL